MPRYVLPLLALALLALAASTAACADGDSPDFPYELYLARVDGGKPILLSRSQTFQDVYWSSDGRLAYTQGRAGGPTEIHVLQPPRLVSAIVRVERVGLFEWVNGGIFLSPDYRCDGCKRQLIKLPPLFSDRQLDNPSAGAAIRTAGPPQYPTLTLIDSDGKTIRTLFRGNDRWHFIQPRVSPDGEWVTFVRFHCRDRCEEG